MKLAGAGTLYITYGSSPGPSRMTDGSVWKLNTKTDEWTDITPEKPDATNQRGFGYAAVSVDSHNPNALIVSSFGHPGGEEIFRSIDAGKSWRPVFCHGGRQIRFCPCPLRRANPNSLAIRHRDRSHEPESRPFHHRLRRVRDVRFYRRRQRNADDLERDEHGNRRDGCATTSESN